MADHGYYGKSRLGRVWAGAKGRSGQAEDGHETLSALDNKNSGDFEDETQEISGL